MAAKTHKFCAKILIRFLTKFLSFFVGGCHEIRQGSLPLNLEGLSGKVSVVSQDENFHWFLAG